MFFATFFDSNVLSLFLAMLFGSNVFWQCFFRARFGIDFEQIFGGSKAEKSLKTFVFLMVFANFHKIDVFKKVMNKA